MNKAYSEVTFYELGAWGYYLEVRCHNCSHWGWLNAGKLGRIYGNRTRAAAAVYKCSCCSGYLCTVRFVHHTQLPGSGISLTSDRPKAPAL